MFNKIKILLLLAILIATGCGKKFTLTEKFDVQPDNPEPGNEITIYYNSDSTSLKGKEDIRVTVFLYGHELHNTIGQSMVKEDGYWKAAVQTTDSTLGMLLKFSSDETIDNNNNSGYVVYLTSDDKILPGAKAGYGNAVSTWGSYYSDLERDFQNAYDIMLEDFNAHPGIKADFIGSYLSVLSKVKSEDMNSAITTELTELEKISDKNEKILTALTEWYARTGNNEKSEEYLEVLRSKYPSAKYIQQQRYRSLANEQDIGPKLEMLKQFESDFPKSTYLVSAYDVTANYYRDRNLYKEAKDFLKENTGKPSVFRFYSVAKKILDENDPNQLQTAFEITELGVKRGRDELSTPSMPKPEYETEQEFLESREYLLGLNLFTNAMALTRMDKIQQALAAAQEAEELTRGKETTVSELYAELLLKNDKPKEALDFIEKKFSSQGTTGKMIEVLSSAYQAIHGSGEGFNEYLSRFQDLAMEKLKSKLKEEMINEQAPDFTLTDMDGNKFSLASLKGKTVILDFWATWCGPCLQSFPGMKKAVEKYSDNPNVKFLFINSWERVQDKKKNAVDFISKNNYPFHVLMDYDDTVIAQYKVNGIPTKFIIDANGNIRFRSIGYNGSTDLLVDELSAMISLVN